VQIGLTYMTGTLVKAGQRIAGALLGEDPGAWVPHAQLWVALFSGAVAGAAAWQVIGAETLWIATFCAVMAAIAGRRLDALQR
jgi:uncharacterized membrane protein YoaK (UPF0700 family)